MVEIGRPVKDTEIDSNTSIEKIFEDVINSACVIFLMPGPSKASSVDSR